jgi:ribosomal protein L37E
LNISHLKCPKCGGEFDFEEQSHLRPGSAMSTLIYDGRKMSVHAMGYYSVRYIHCPHCGKRSKFNVQNGRGFGVGYGMQV